MRESSSERREASAAEQSMQPEHGSRIGHIFIIIHYIKHSQRTVNQTSTPEDLFLLWNARKEMEADP